MKRILVIGASGQVGSTVIAALRGVEGIFVRAAVRDVGSAIRKWNGQANVQPVRFDFLDRASQDTALTDCDSLFLLRPPQLNSDFEDLIAWARQHGVAHIVFLSVQVAEGNRFIPHHKIEQRLMLAACRTLCCDPPTSCKTSPARSMMNWCADTESSFRPGTPALRSSMSLTLPAWQPTLLTQAGTQHHGQAYTLTSETPLNFQQMADQLTAGLGTPITYESPGPWRFYRTLKRDGRKPGLILVMLPLSGG